MSQPQAWRRKGIEKLFVNLPLTSVVVARDLDTSRQQTCSSPGVKLLASMRAFPFASPRSFRKKSRTNNSSSRESRAAPAANQRCSEVPKKWGPEA